MQKTNTGLPTFIHEEHWEEQERRRDTITRTELLTFIARNEEAHGEHRTAHKDQQDKLEVLEVVSKDTNERLQKVEDRLDNLVNETSELIEVFKTLQALSKFIMWVGKIAKPVMIVAGLITAATLALKGISVPLVK